MPRTDTTSKIRQPLVSKALITAVAAFGLVAIQANEAAAVSSAVRMACIGDYFSYCSAHRVGSQELRVCMNENGHKLSKRCVGALVAAGEVSKTEVARRAASAR